MKTSSTNPFSEPDRAAPPAESVSANPSPLPGQVVYWRILLAGAVLGLLANLIFYERLPGISAVIFVLSGLAALVVISRAAGVPLTWRGAWPALPLVILSAMVALRAAPFLSFLNIAACLVLLIALAHTYPGRSVLDFGFLDYAANGIVGAVEIMILRPVQTLDRAWAERRSSSQQAHSSGAAVLRGLLIALPVLFVFTVLFSAADAVFERMVNQAFSWLKLENFPEFVTRLMFSVVVGWAVAGGLAYAIRTLPEKATAHHGRSGKLGAVEAGVVLGSLDALFGLFVAVQVRYFFGGKSNISVEGFTYSEYARRGFAELVIVAVLTLGLMFAAQSLAARNNKGQFLWVEGLGGVLVSLTGIILVSAFQRMQIYEAAYGFTQLRFLVYVFIAWLAILLITSFVTMHLNRAHWFATAVFIAALGYVMSLNILNMDAFIARQNLRRVSAGLGSSSEDGRTVDARYLATLSDDAVPPLLEAYAVLPPQELEVLGSALHLRLNELDALAQSHGWPQPGGTGWNYARWRAWVLLQAARPGLENFEPQRYYWDFPIN